LAGFCAEKYRAGEVYFLPCGGRDVQLWKWMCGIAFLRNIEQQESTLDPTLLKIWTSVLVDISQRGPDLFDVLKIDNLQFAGAVLHIQGNEITRQPYVDPLQKSILLWNGEVFDGLQRIPDGSDTQMISAELSRLTEGSTHRSICEIGEVIVETLSRVQGPYAFIYYSPFVQAIFYGRDPFGRRSLMALSKRITEEEREQSIHNHLLLSSVCLEMEIERDYLLEELPVSGIFCMPLNPQSQSLHFPWPASRIKLGRRWDDSFEPKPNSFVSNSSEQFLAILKNLLIKRIHCVHSLSGPLKTVSLENTCSIGVLFSGGIDSVLLAAVLHLALPEEMNHLTIDLLNVTFEGQNSKSNDPSPDRLAAIAALGELEVSFIFQPILDPSLASFPAKKLAPGSC
jgi:asparagine synthetase B (glutamine-hydrolysing)